MEYQKFSGNAEICPLGMQGAADLLKHASSQLCYRAKVGHSRSYHVSEVAEMLQNKETSLVPSFKVTRGRWNRHRSIGYDFLLVIHE